MTDPEITTEQLFEWLSRVKRFVLSPATGEWVPSVIPDTKQREAIRSRLTEFDALKAEVERLEKEKQIVMDDAITVAEYWKSKVEKAEAELELARPLLDEMDSILGQLAAEGKEWPIFRAKLRAYRVGKEGK